MVIYNQLHLFRKLRKLKTLKMKRILNQALIFATIFICQNLSLAQAPDLGTTADFVIFTTVGATTNTGISHLTGNVGTNSGSITGFGNVNGVMHNGDGASAQCASDLLNLYTQLNTVIPTFFPAPALGNGQILTGGVYSIAGNATLDQSLNFDAQGDENAVFILQIQGTLSTNSASEIILSNGALACNIFWKVEGLVSMASGTKMKGTIVANNAAINMSTGVNLEGRILSTSGAVGVNGVVAYTPTGCGSLVLDGPIAPELGTAVCYAIFSSNGEVTNIDTSIIKGDIGTNVGLTTGFNPLLVDGMIHPIPDGSTAQCATDLLITYDYLNTLNYDIELLYPAQFGNDLVLTPHTYLLNAATSFNGRLYLDAAGNKNAIFVIQINGALTTSTYANVELINGTLAENVYWKIEGALNINDYSLFKGTLVVNNGAINLQKGMKLEGRAFTTTGALNTAAIKATMPAGCITTNINSFDTDDSNLFYSIYPNPFNTNSTITISSNSHTNPSELKIYNFIGQELLNVLFTDQTTSFESSNLPAGMYFYKVLLNNKIIQTGKLIASGK